MEAAMRGMDLFHQFRERVKLRPNIHFSPN